MTENPEVDPEKVKPENSTEDQMEADPAAIQERELQRYEQQINQIHDNIEAMKMTSNNISQFLRDQAEEAETEEIKEEYERLANAARTAYRRIEYGDKTVLRGGV